MAMSQSQKASGQFSYSEKLLPQAEMLEEKKNKRSLFIGIPKETDIYETRIRFGTVSTIFIYYLSKMSLV